MDSWLRHWKHHDWRFAGLLLVSLAVIGLYLSASLGRLEQSGAGWRRIDIEALKSRLEEGNLSGREAKWYHPSTPEELRAGGGSNE